MENVAKLCKFLVINLRELLINYFACQREWHISKEIDKCSDFVINFEEIIIFISRAENMKYFVGWNFNYFIRKIIIFILNLTLFVFVATNYTLMCLFKSVSFNFDVTQMTDIYDISYIYVIVVCYIFTWFVPSHYGLHSQYSTFTFLFRGIGIKLLV